MIILGGGGDGEPLAEAATLLQIFEVGHDLAQSAKRAKQAIAIACRKNVSRGANRIAGSIPARPI
jgi:hypothetical protein